MTPGLVRLVIWTTSNLIVLARAQPQPATSYTAASIWSDLSAAAEMIAYFFLRPLVCLFIGVGLLLLGLRIPRVTLGFGTAFALAASSFVLFERAEWSQARPGILLLLSLLAGLIGFWLGFTMWIVGTLCSALVSGMLLAVSCILLLDHFLSKAVRWIIFSFISIAFTLLCSLGASRLGIPISSSILGAALLVSGFDQLISGPHGISAGLKFVLLKTSTWHESADDQQAAYSPSTTARVLIVVGWGLSIVGALTQYRLYRHSFPPAAPDFDFDEHWASKRRPRFQGDHSIRATFSGHYGDERRALRERARPGSKRR